MYTGGETEHARKSVAPAGAGGNAPPTPDTVDGLVGAAGEEAGCRWLHLCVCCLPSRDVSSHSAATSRSSPITGRQSTSRESGAEPARPRPLKAPPSSTSHRVPLPAPADVPPPPLSIPSAGPSASLPTAGASPRPCSQRRGAPEPAGQDLEGPSNLRGNASTHPSAYTSTHPSVDASMRPSVDTSTRSSADTSTHPSIDASMRPSVDLSTAPA